MAGLLRYLVGPGKSNEHVEPHLVAGDTAILTWFDDNELNIEAARRIAKSLDAPLAALPASDPKLSHVWHCSLAVKADEGRLSDTKWKEIAEKFIAKMGFDDAGGTKASTRWVAVHHGLSSGGNDHIHIALNVVREDGTKVSLHNDFARAQKAARQLEKECGLQVLPGSERGRSSRGYHPAEQVAAARRKARGKFEAARREGTEERSWWALSVNEREELVENQRAADQPRWELARKVRACASASADEGEFVRRLRRQGLLVRARFAEGTQDVVTGYSVAIRPEFREERPIWYGGGSLAHDLKLPRLRSEWPDTPEHSSIAAAEWVAAKRGRRPVSPGRESLEFSYEEWSKVGKELAKVREQMRQIPVDDREEWARFARSTAGAFAAWSIRVEDEPGPLAAVADSLSRSAELRREGRRVARWRGRPVSNAASFLMVGLSGKYGAVMDAVLLHQLGNFAKAVYDMHQADKDAQRAEEIAQTVRSRLVTVAAQLPDPIEADHQRGVEAVRVARVAQGHRGTIRPPIESVISTPKKESQVRSSSQKGAGTGTENER